MKALFDPAYQRYPSQRYPIYARGGMVNASSPQAAAAGLEILRRGGNAMDAAVAAAAALTVVEPTANGIGSYGGVYPARAGRSQRRGWENAHLWLDPRHGIRRAHGLGGAGGAVWPPAPFPEPGPCRGLCQGGLSLCAQSRPHVEAGF